MVYSRYRDDQNKATISFPNVPSFLYWWYKKKIIKKFNLQPNTNETNSLDTRFQTFISDGGRVNIEWDTWSGLSIVALDDKTEKLLLDILEYLK